MRTDDTTSLRESGSRLASNDRSREKRMTTADHLRAAKALIDTPEKWGSGLSTGRPGRLCASEAIHAIGLSIKADYAHGCYRCICVATGSRSSTEWNDSHTHAEVMAGFDAAIALAEAEGA